MRWGTLTATALILLASSCAPKDPAPSPPSGPSSPAPAALDVAVPYTRPAQPPQQSEPLVVQPSRDAQARLSKITAGKLVDSGNFHASRWREDEPMGLDDHISFMTPSGHIICTGGSNWIICYAQSATLPAPPRPVQSPSGNWEPYIEFGDEITYGVAAGNPMLPQKANVLPYGSTLRFGDIECLSARDGITCVNFASSTGFHLSRDDLTPMRTVDSMPVDSRVEPRTPGNAYCGAVVSNAAIKTAITALPNSGGLHWMPVGTGDFYTCHDLQLFQAGTNDYDNNHQMPAMPTYVLAFDRGRFVGPITDHAYSWLRGEVDKSDPTLIHLTVHLIRNDKSANPQFRARYADGRITLLDSVPPDAVPVN